MFSAAQSCLILCSPMDYSPPSSSVHGISSVQARIMEWVAISYPRKSSWPGDQTLVPCVSCIGRQILYHWATWESQSMMRPKHMYLKTLHWQLYWVGPKVHYIRKIYGKIQMNFFGQPNIISIISCPSPHPTSTMKNHSHMPSLLIFSGQSVPPSSKCMPEFP